MGCTDRRGDDTVNPVKPTTTGAIMDEQKDESVREELKDFWYASEPYLHASMTNAGVAVDLFLKRNHVVRLPEQGQLKVTRDGETILVNGHLFSGNSDLFHWQQAVENSSKLVEARAEGLRWAVLDLEKRRAVLVYLTKEQEEKKQRDLYREKLLDEIARQYFQLDYGDIRYSVSKAVVERIADLELQLAAKS
jgi:hypothetical protein